MVKEQKRNQTSFYEEKIMESEEREIIKLLFESGFIIDIYTIHTKLGLSVTQIFKAIKNLEKEKLIKKERETIRFDKRKIKSAEKIFINPDKYWKNRIDFRSQISQTLDNDLKGALDSNG